MLHLIEPLTFKSIYCSKGNTQLLELKKKRFKNVKKVRKIYI